MLLCCVFPSKAAILCVCVCVVRTRTCHGMRKIFLICVLCSSQCRFVVLDIFAPIKDESNNDKEKKRKTKRSTFTVVGDVDLSLCVFDFLLHVLHNSTTDDALKWQGL